MKMHLCDFVSIIAPETTPEANPEITFVTNDSRKAGPGALFCAIPGSKINGVSFIPAAIQAGAAAIIAPNVIPGLTIPCIAVPDIYKAWGLICEIAAGNPAQKIEFHAITGTNGKTTSAMLLRKIFSEASPLEKCGLLSTILYDPCGTTPPEEAARTTPDAQNFQKLISQMKNNGCSRCVMELSSHGLHQHRTGSIKFKTAIFTNLTGDHLDYHKTMENYYQAKKILFTELLSADGHAIINKDDPWGKRLSEEIPNAVTFSAKPGASAQFKIQKAAANGTDFVLTFDTVHMEIHSPLIGYYNVQNVTGAALAAVCCGIPPETVEKILSEPFAVPGRLEYFELKNGAGAFVDYAHTDDALERVLNALIPLKGSQGRLICVFGCGGDRDRTKRPRMGAVVSRLADMAIITDDNPRSEKPKDIAEEIKQGIPPGKACRYIGDREKAIRQAIEESHTGDIVLVAGKGHETTQEIAGVKHPFDDRKIILSLNGFQSYSKNAEK